MPSPQEREEALFRAAVELTPDAARRAFLDQACAGDAALRQRLEALLAAHDEPEGSLATAAPSAKATMKLEFADEPKDEAVGQTLGRCKLLEKVGEGGCGVVYVAEQTEPVRRRVALKVIKLGMDTKQVVARFESERQAMAMMDHPNIAKVLDAGTMEANPRNADFPVGESTGRGALARAGWKTRVPGRPCFVRTGAGDCRFGAGNLNAVQLICFDDQSVASLRLAWIQRQPACDGGRNQQAIGFRRFISPPRHVRCERDATHRFADGL